MHRFTAGKPSRALFFWLGVTALLLPLAMRLRPQADLASLLPADSPSSAAYRRYLEDFGATETVFVVLRAPGTPGADEVLAGEGLAEGLPIQEAAWRLEELLEGKGEVAKVRVGLESEDETFLLEQVLPRAPLLLRADDEREYRERAAARLAPGAIEHRASLLRRRLLRLGSEAERALLLGDPFGFLGDLAGLAMESPTIGLDPLTSTFVAEGGRTALAIVTPRSSELDPDAGRRLLAQLHDAEASLRTQMPELELLAVGGPLYAAQDETLLRADLEITLATSLLACGLVVILAFGEPWTPLGGLLVVGSALVWTGALLVASLDSISALAVGFAAVLVGLGVDYAIHGGTRFREHRFSGDDPERAWQRTVRETGPAIATSAATTAAGFLVLLSARFAPLRQLGLLVGIGILAMLAASWSVGGAWLRTLGSHVARRPPTRLWNRLGSVGSGVVTLAETKPRWVLGGWGLALLVALPGLARLSFSTDLTSLRPDDHPAREAQALVAELFGLGGETATVLVGEKSRGTGTEGGEEALTVARRVAGRLRGALAESASVSTPSDWAIGPREATRRAEILRTLPLEEAVREMDRALTAEGLDPAAFAPGTRPLLEIAEGQLPGDPAVTPPWLTLSIGRSGAVALSVRSNAGADPARVHGTLRREVDSLREEGLDVELASAAEIGVELEQHGRQDLATLATLALVAMVVVLLVGFRGHPARVALALLPVAAGLTLTLGLWGYYPGELDLLAVAVIPMVLGIGIDDGLHALHGRRSAPGGDLAASVRAASRAMMLTSVTTCLGFGSLALSSVPGLRRGGLLVSLAILFCLAATLLLLPALARSLPSLAGRDWRPEASPAPSPPHDSGS